MYPHVPLAFTLDGVPRVNAVACADCGGAHDAVTGFVLRDGNPHAVYFAWWYPHPGEAYVDIALGSSGVPDALDDAVMFGCRIGHVASQSAPAASLVDAGTRLASDRRRGLRLDRSAARRHPRLGDFWAVVDWLVVNDPTLHEHVFHMPAAGR